MKEKDKKIWELLGRKLTGEADSKDLERLEQLLREEDKTEEVQQLEEDLKAYWEEVKEMNQEESEELQERTAYYKEQVMKKITSASVLKEQKKKGSFHKKRKLWRRVAVMVVLLVGGWFVYQSFTAHQRNLNTVTTKKGSKTTVTLPDGTKVWLNADSKLIYPNDFQHITKREVTLVGEGYFKVKHDACHPFIIHTKGLTIKDIGTEFNLKAYPDDDKSALSLIKGSVSVAPIHDKDKNLVMKPGEKVIYYTHSKTKPEKVDVKQQGENIFKQKKQIVKKIEQPLQMKVTKIHPVVTKTGLHLISETAWKEDRLVFQGERFEALSHQLSRRYGVDISIENKEVANYTFTGIFEEETLNQALKALQMVRPFKYTIEKNYVTIYN